MDGQGEPGMAAVSSSAAENPTVRRYRFLLRTASPGVLEAAHVHALGALGAPARAEVLGLVRSQLVAGLRSQPEDTRVVARLVILGERRRPGALLTAYRPALLSALAEAVTSAPAAQPALAGYEQWDGVEPQLVEELVELPGRDWSAIDTDPQHQWNLARGRMAGNHGWIGGW